MKIGEMKDSKYLKKEDVGRGVLATIESMEQQNVAMDDQPEELKWILHFKENLGPEGKYKALVLNWTNIQLIAKALGSEETNDWIGKQIVLYTDENVSFGGKLVGGIRIRAPKLQARQPEPKPFDDDISF